jgi:hypothetical protein
VNILEKRQKGDDFVPNIKIGAQGQSQIQYKRYKAEIYSIIIKI